MSRYFDKVTIINDNIMYNKKLKKRGVSRIEQYATPEFPIISEADKQSIDCYEYVWKHGDTFSRLAEDFYGAPEEWWLIAQFNQLPTEAHLKIGQVIKIPVNLGDLLRIM